MKILRERLNIILVLWMAWNLRPQTLLRDEGFMLYSLFNPSQIKTHNSRPIDQILLLKVKLAKVKK